MNTWTTMLSQISHSPSQPQMVPKDLQPQKKVASFFQATRNDSDAFIANQNFKPLYDETHVHYKLSQFSTKKKKKTATKLSPDNLH